jgi:hypothetical protein
VRRPPAEVAEQGTFSAPAFLHAASSGSSATAALSGVPVAWQHRLAGFNIVNYLTAAAYLCNTAFALCG